MIAATRRRVTLPAVPRWPVIGLVFVAFAALTQLSLGETGGPPNPGLRARVDGDRLVVDWVQPASLVWDDGVRPGQTVTAIDGQAVNESRDAGDFRTAQTLQVRTTDGQLISASVTAAERLADQRRWIFLTQAVAFLLVGGITWLLATETAAALALLGVASSASVALVTSIATPFGSAWSLGAVYVSLQTFGASLCLLFLAFPINWMSARWGRLAALACVGATMAVLVPYPLIVARDPAGYDLLAGVSLGVLVVQVAAAIVLAALPLTPVSHA